MKLEEGLQSCFSKDGVEGSQPIDPEQGPIEYASPNERGSMAAYSIYLLRSKRR